MGLRGAGRRTATALAIAGAASLGLAATADAAAVIDNGTVRLGVDNAGQLNFGGFGVTYVPTGNDGTRAGCACEGWGAGGTVDGQRFSGLANNNEATTVTQVGFTADATTARSVTDVGALRVTHEFRPAGETPNLYEVLVTMRNTSPDKTVSDSRYTRLMDWDVEPTQFSEVVTIKRGTAAAKGTLLYSDDNGFASNDPFGARAPLLAGTVNTDFVDSGPADHGALFDFGFGDLAPGQEISFRIFYGATGTEAAADEAVSKTGLELFSYGQTRDGGATGAPNTFIFGFRGIGGDAVIPPTIELTPETATKDVGNSHAMTATVKSAEGIAVPGASVVFSRTGANAGSDTATTDSEGKATASYTGAAAGDDNITACVDTNSSGTCDDTEVADTATVTWSELVAGCVPTAGATIAGCGVTSIGTVFTYAVTRGADGTITGSADLKNPDYRYARRSGNVTCLLTGTNRALFGVVDVTSSRNRVYREFYVENSRAGLRLNEKLSTGKIPPAGSGCVSKLPKANNEPLVKEGTAYFS